MRRFSSIQLLTLAVCLFIACALPAGAAASAVRPAAGQVDAKIDPMLLAPRGSETRGKSPRGIKMVPAAVAAGLVAVAVLAPGSTHDPAPDGRTAPRAPAIARPFSPTSFWNQPLRADAPIDPLSGVYNADLRRQLTQWKPWINTTQFSSPVYTVPSGQPTVRVTLDNVQRDLQAAWERVPIPPGARPAAGSDHTMIVWQPSTDTMWEFWQAEKRADGWHARFGGKMANVSTNPGHYTNPTGWGATATSLPMLGGLIRISELRAGRIDHALAIAIPQPKANAFSWPAQRSDGRYNSPSAIPEGTRFRIDPKLDLSKVSMSPVVRQLAVAAQRYGLVVRDTAGSVAFYAEDPTPTGSNPYTGAHGLFGGRYPSQLLAQFPWRHLQALRTNITRKR